MTFKPTAEQEAIVRAAQQEKRLKIDAAAGASKTTTLTLVANAIHKPSLYLAFNKEVAEEARERFPSHVECRTTHSLAFAQFGRPLEHKLSRPKKGGYKNLAGTAGEIAKYYHLRPIKVGNKEVSGATLALLVKDAVKRFETSSDDTLSSHHISWRDVRKLFPDERLRNRALSAIERTAKKLWQDRINPHSEVLATHNTYLKLFQLSKPVLDYSVIYLDEAQDSSDVVLDIFKSQTHAKLIAVGDNYQAIYGWNGAVNAMQKLQYPTKQLTMSFRFGKAIADVAKAIIRGGIDVKGWENVDSVIGVVDKTKPFTKVFRTNAALLEDAVAFVEAGYTVRAEGNIADFVRQLQSAQALFEGDMKKVKHESVVMYRDWGEYEEAAKEYPEINRVKAIVLQGRVEQFIDALSKVKSSEDAPITLTTCHKSKGREWDQVILAEDFRVVTESTPQEELNLLYVGATRAKKVLEINEAVEAAIELWEDYNG